MQFHLSPRSRNPRLESLLSVRASRDPLYNLIHHLSLRTYIVQWNVKEKKEKKKKSKGCFTRRTLGWLHSKLMRMIVKPYRPNVLET